MLCKPKNPDSTTPWVGGGAFLTIFDQKMAKIVKNAPPPSLGVVESGFFRFTKHKILYLTFSESFETIEPIFQKILAAKNFIFKNWQLSG